MDVSGFLYSPLGAALIAGILLFGGLFYMYGTEGRYQKMEKQELLRVFFLPPAIVAASIYWFVSGRSPSPEPTVSAVSAVPVKVPAPIEVPAEVPEFDPAAGPSTPILTEPFAD